MSPDTKITLIGLGVCLLVTALVMCVNYISEHPKPPKSDPQQNYQPYTPPPRPKPKAASKPKQTRKCKVSPETLEAMHLQADAEMHIAEALKARAEKERDPVKKAGLEKRAALAWVRFCSILDKTAAIEESSD